MIMAPKQELDVDPSSTANEETGTSPDEKNGTGENNHDDSVCEKKDNKNGNNARWPETVGTKVQQVFQAWTFSYMSPLLQKGRRQFMEGHHLDQDDLYNLPDSMKAQELVSKFRCVVVPS